MLTAVDDLFRRYTTTLLTIYVVAGIAVIVGLAFIIRALVRTYLQYRGKLLVVCPEAEKYATVEIDRPLAAITSLFGTPDLRIENCSRWPERQLCSQDCVWQIGLYPLGRPIRELLTSWYRGEKCALCGRHFGNFPLFDRLALLSPEGNVLGCEAVRPELFPDILYTHKPVCWECKGAKTRSRHSDMVAK